MSKIVDDREERKKIVINSKTKAFKFDRPMSGSWEKLWEYSVISDLSHDVLL
jgi:hypothetical protein